LKIYAFHEVAHHRENFKFRTSKIILHQDGIVELDGNAFNLLLVGATLRALPVMLLTAALWIQ
jgi:hypothetical protein